MPSNLDFYQTLYEKLFSQVCCGPPKTSMQRFIGMGYPVTLLIIAQITSVGAWKVKSRWNWKHFLPVFAICTITGWFWGIYIEKYDPGFPGWLFLPWSITNIEFILTLEDWLFYPLCTCLFYFIFLALKKSEKKPSDAQKISLQVFHITAASFFCYFTGPCGKSLSYQCAIPGIALFFYIWDRWDVRHYLKFMTVILLIEILWDYFAVSWLSYLPGMAWASQWVYIAFDQHNNYIHSRVFLDYGTHKWAWIFKNPIEITPWFAISVGMYFYSMTVAYTKFFIDRGNR